MCGVQKGLLVLALHVLDEVDDSVGVAHLVVIPRHQLDEGRRQLNAGLGVEDGGVGVAKEVGGHHHVFGVGQVALHGTVSGSPEINKKAFDKTPSIFMGYGLSTKLDRNQRFQKSRCVNIFVHAQK